MPCDARFPQLWVSHVGVLKNNSLITPHSHAGALLVSETVTRAEGVRDMLRRAPLGSSNFR